MSEVETALPPGQAPVAPPADDSKILDLAIEKSKSEIANAQNAPVKRGRGRPRKIQPAPASPSVAQPAGPAAPLFDATPYLKQAVQVPFAVAAAKFKCDELKVTDEQALPVAIAADQFLRAYAPNLEKADPKTIAAVAFATSLGMLCFEKYSVYSTLEKTPAQVAAAEPVPNDIPSPVSDEQAFAPSPFSGRIPASDAFRTKNPNPWPVSAF